MTYPVHVIVIKLHYVPGTFIYFLSTLVLPPPPPSCSFTNFAAALFFFDFDAFACFAFFDLAAVFFAFNRKPNNGTKITRNSPEKCQNEIYTDNLNEQQDKVSEQMTRTRRKRLYEKDYAPYRRDRVPVFQPPHQRLQRLVFVGQTARERECERKNKAYSKGISLHHGGKC